MSIKKLNCKDIGFFALGSLIGLIICEAIIYFAFGAGFVTTYQTSHRNGLIILGNNKRSIAQVSMRCWDTTSKLVEVVFESSQAEILVDPQAQLGNTITVYPSILDRIYPSNRIRAHKIIFYVPNQETKNILRMLLDLRLEIEKISN